MWWLAGAILGMAIAAAAWMVTEAYRVRLIREEVAFARLPASLDGLRVLFLSDIHRRSIPARLLRRVEQAGGVDLVCIGGDLREGGVPWQRTKDNARLLAQLGPVYAVYGNHDYDDPIRPLDALLREEGVQPLVNGFVLVKGSDGSRLKICGVDDPITGRSRLAEALRRGEGDEPGLFTLLLSHDPNILDRLDGAQVDLVLSGHTHGGQIALPWYGPLLRSTEILTYLRGWHVQRRGVAGAPARLYVSTGFGTSKLPLRLLAPAEVRLFILRRASRPGA